MVIHALVSISFILYSSNFLSSIQTPAVSKDLTLVSGAEAKGCNKEKIGGGIVNCEYAILCLRRGLYSQFIIFVVINITVEEGNKPQN